MRRDILLAGASPLFTDHVTVKVGNYNALWALAIRLYTPFSENMLYTGCDAFILAINTHEKETEYNRLILLDRGNTCKYNITLPTQASGHTPHHPSPQIPRLELAVFIKAL